MVAATCVVVACGVGDCDFGTGIFCALANFGHSRLSGRYYVWVFEEDFNNLADGFHVNESMYWVNLTVENLCHEVCGHVRLCLFGEDGCSDELLHCCYLFHSEFRFWEFNLFAFLILAVVKD